MQLGKFSSVFEKESHFAQGGVNEATSSHPTVGADKECKILLVSTNTCLLGRRLKLESSPGVNIK